MKTEAFKSPGGNITMKDSKFYFEYISIWCSCNLNRAQYIIVS